MLDYLVRAKTLSLFWQKLYALGHISIVLNGQILHKYSSHLAHCQDRGAFYYFVVLIFPTCYSGLGRSRAETNSQQTLQKIVELSMLLQPLSALSKKSKMLETSLH